MGTTESVVYILGLRYALDDDAEAGELLASLEANQASAEALSPDLRSWLDSVIVPALADEFLRRSES